jgi:hypothetical protein
MVLLIPQEGQEAAKMYFIRHGVVCTRGTVVTHGGFFGNATLFDPICKEKTKSASKQNIT